MKLVIFGSRDVFPTIDDITDAVRSLKDPKTGRRLIDVPDEDVTEVICGGARGADEAGKDWAKWFGIPVRTFPAAWEAHGKRAGFIRNKEMAEYAELGLGFWKGESSGTANMVAHMVLLDKLVYLVGA